jgi:hypothetical protein
MFRRSTDGIAIATSIRMNDGAILIGTINCGMSGKLESLLASEVSFIEFVSKEGQQRFISHHQIASIEPLASISEPELPKPSEDEDPYRVLGITFDATVEEAMAAFQDKLRIYNPERWAAADVPFEFGRYAAEKTRQLNMAFTSVRAAIQKRAEDRRASLMRGPMFGAARVAG